MLLNRKYVKKHGKKVRKDLIEQVKEIQRSRNAREEWYSATKYSSIVIGIHNYHKMH